MANDRQLRYMRINTDIYTDTMKSSCITKRGNTYVHIFSASICWIQYFPMTKKSDAHEGISILFQIDGSPNILIIDSSREQTLDKFSKKYSEASYHVRETESYSPWSNQEKIAIKELRIATGRDLRRIRSCG